MVKDPYSVLGVSREATEEELKTAYRKLVKKYHPDRFTDPDQKKRAEEKMKEINEAYDRALDEKSGRAGSSYQSYGSTGRGSSEGVYFRVRNCINEGRYTEAETILNYVPYGERTAEWHFLVACIQYRRGWIYDAMNSAATAVRMEPDNPEFRELYDRLEEMSKNAGAEYTSVSGMDSCGCDVCDICSALACANCCCSLCR